MLFLTCTKTNDIKHRSHPSILKIIKIVAKYIFSFWQVLPQDIEKAILEVNKNECASNKILTKSFQTITNEIGAPLTNCINSSSEARVFQMI